KRKNLGVPGDHGGDVHPRKLTSTGQDRLVFSGRATSSQWSQPDPLHLVLCEPLLGAVIKLGRARAFVRGHFPRMLERAATGEIGGDAGCTKRMAADRRRDAG